MGFVPKKSCVCGSRWRSRGVVRVVAVVVAVHGGRGRRGQLPGRSLGKFVEVRPGKASPHARVQQRPVFATLVGECHQSGLQRVLQSLDGKRIRNSLGELVVTMDQAKQRILHHVRRKPNCKCAKLFAV